LQFLANQVLPVIKKKKLSNRVDIFIEKNFFEGESAKYYLSRAQELGFEVVVHADQLSLSGGTQLAVELGAQSADHVIQLGESEIQSLAHSETVAVLLPLADLYMKCPYPPARSLIDAGACVALATDYNPGSCPSMDIMLVGLLARLQMKMTLSEIIAAWTVGAAQALRLKDTGSLQRGFVADLQVINQDWRGLFYQAGHSDVTRVFAQGKLIFSCKL
jgi:imidazolonepropionase